MTQTLATELPYPILGATGSKHTPGRDSEPRAVTLGSPSPGQGLGTLRTLCLGSHFWHWELSSQSFPLQEEHSQNSLQAFPAPCWPLLKYQSCLLR